MTTSNHRISAVTLHRLRREFSYDSATGLLEERASKMPAGKVSQHGYLRVRFDGEWVMAHRLIWLMVHGVWPTGQINHIDGNKLNNLLSNLRDVSQATNMQNQRRAHSDNASGLLGVYWHKRQCRFYSQIRVNKVLKHLGYFPNADLAHEAYLRAKRELHPGNTL